MHVNKVITFEWVITLMVSYVFKPEHDKKNTKLNTAEQHRILIKVIYMALKDYQDFRAMITVLVKTCSVNVIMNYNSVHFYESKSQTKNVFRLSR